MKTPKTHVKALLGALSLFGIVTASHATITATATFSGTATATGTAATGNNANLAANWSDAAAPAANKLGIYKADVSSRQVGVSTSALTTGAIRFDAAATGGGFTFWQLGSAAACEIRLRTDSSEPIRNNATSTQIFNAPVKYFTTAGGTPTGTGFTNFANSGDIIFQNAAFVAGTVNPAIDNNAANIWFRAASGRTITVGAGGPGVIQGAGQALILGPGTVKFAGTSANTYSGGTTIESGTLQLGKTAAVPGTFNFKGGTIMSDGATARTVTGAMNFNGAADGTIIFGGSGGLTFSGALSLGTANSYVQVDNTADTTFSGVISGTKFTKTGPGRLIVSAANTLSGSITNAAGTLKLANGSGSAVGTGSLTVSNAAILTGTGSMSGAATLLSGALVSAGDTNSAGTLTLGSLNWNVNATNHVNILNVAVSEGVNQDKIVVTGALTFGGSAQIILDGSSVVGFSNTSDYSWRIATAGSISGFNAANVVITPIGFGSLGTKVFKARVSGNDLYVDFFDPISITAATVGGTNAVSSAANFSVTASGSGPIGYQWKKNGNNISNETNSTYTIASVVGADSGNYSVVVSSPYDSATASGSLVVPAVIQVDPVGATKSPGDSVTFNVTADGGSPLTYQWKKDGVNITDATTASYSINPVHGTNYGSYTVDVSANNYNTVSSAAAVLNVSPEIVTALPATYAASEGNVTFTVGATGSPTLGYTWKKGATTISTGDSHYSGADTAALTILGLVESDSDTYTVTVSNGYSPDATSSVALSVTTFPTINSQPASRTNIAGETATFTVNAVGASPLSFQWRTNGVPLSNGGNISGATNTTLTISNVQQVDAQDYDVVVSNNLGSSNSVTAHLTVIDPLAITGFTTNALTVVSNNNAVFTVTVSGSSPVYEWKKGASVLTDGVKYSGATSASLTVLNALIADNDTYTVTVTNLANSVTTNATLTVIDPVVISAQPVNQTVGVGSNATFTVTAVGTSRAYQWRRDGSNIGSATNSAYTLVAATHADETAIFTCVISNFAGAVISSNAQVVVQDVPVITSNPTAVTNNFGTDATFVVTASGQSLTYQWYSTNTGAAVLLSDDAKFTGTTAATLTVNDVDLTNAIGYLAVVANVAGKATSTVAQLTVDKAPTITLQPGNLSVSTGNSATFKVTATGNPLAYQWKLNGAPISGATTTAVTISAVNQSKYGYYSVDVSNHLGVASSTVVTLDSSITNLWNKVPTNSATAILNTDVVQRGLAYNPTTDHLLMSDRGTTNIYVFDATTGAYVSTLNLTGVNVGSTSGGFPFYFNRIGVGDDGAIYTANLTLAASTVHLRVYRWADENATPTVIYDGTGDGAIARWGDGFAVHGSGASTEILVTGSGTTSAVLLTTANGTTFSSKILNFTGAATGDLYIGLAFGETGTIYSGRGSTSIKRWTYDVPTGVATLASTITGLTANDIGLGINTNKNWAYFVFDNYTTSSNSHKLQIYDLSQGTAVQRADFVFSTSAQLNAGNSAFNMAAVASDGSRWWALDTANGILALKSQTAPTIVSDPTAQSGNAGDSVTFSITIDQPVVRAQLLKGGVAVAASSTNISGNTVSLTLTNINKFSEGSYSAIVFSAGGQVTSGSASLTVGNDPVILTPPANVTKGAGSNAVFTVGAAGAGVTYQWYKGVTGLANTPGAIVGAQSANLTLVNVSDAVEDTYSVVVSNAFGSFATSSGATLTVINPPVFTTPLANTVVNNGQTAHLNSVVVGDATISYSWTKDGNPLSDGGHVTGTATSSLTITGADQTDAGVYVVTAVNAANSATSTATLSVLDPPAITVQPLSQTVNATSNVTFSVTATGGDLSYVWSKNGVPIGGATNSSYTLTGVLNPDEGDYSVYVSNGAGNITSSNATLTVIDPAIILDPVNTSINLGGSGSLTVGAVGSSALKYQWYFKNAALKGATNATVNFTAATTAIGGNYFAVVTNTYGKATSAIVTLTVVTPPSFNAPLAPIAMKPKTNVPAGTRVVMTTVAKGTAPSYQWKFNSSDIAGSTTATNILSAAKLTDAGTYSVVLSNQAGVSTSIGVNLGVFPDTNAPTVGIKTPVALSASFSTTNPTASFLATGTAADAAQVTNVFYRLNGSAWTAVQSFVPKDANSLAATWTNSLTGVVGTNILEAYSVDWSGNTSKLAKVIFYYHVPAVLTVSIDEGDTRAGEGSGSAWPPDYRGTKPGGPGMIAAPDIVPTNGATLYVNRGLYTLTAIAGHNQLFTNWASWVTGGSTSYVGTTKITFNMQTNLNLRANFIHNPWMEAKGFYYGLVTNGAVDFDISGGINFSVLTNQMFSGKVFVDGDAISLAGKFNTDGSQTVILSRAKLGKPNLVLSITNLFGTAGSSGTNQIVGTLSDTNSGKVASILADQAVYIGLTNHESKGTYTMVLPKANDASVAPGGYGYATVTIAGDAKVTAVGAFADSTILAPQVGYVSKDGRWPMFNQIYATKKIRYLNFTNSLQFHTNAPFLGMYLGWVNLTNPSAGTLRWTKTVAEPTNVISGALGVYSNYYPAGFSLDMPLTVKSYINNGVGIRLISVTNGIVSFTDGNLPSSPQTHQMRYGNDAKVVLLSGTNIVKVSTNAELGKLALAFDPKLGKMTGSFTNGISLLPTGAAKAITAAGVVLQPDNIAYGYFLGTNQSGAVTFEADPTNP